MTSEQARDPCGAQKARTTNKQTKRKTTRDMSRHKEFPSEAHDWSELGIRCGWAGVERVRGKRTLRREQERAEQARGEAERCAGARPIVRVRRDTRCEWFVVTSPRLWRFGCGCLGGRLEVSRVCRELVRSRSDLERDWVSTG